jgi:hypothetical protein
MLPRSAATSKPSSVSRAALHCGVPLVAGPALMRKPSAVVAAAGAGEVPAWSGGAAQAASKGANSQKATRQRIVPDIQRTKLIQ